MLVHWCGDVWDVEDEEEVVDREFDDSRVRKRWKWFFRSTAVGMGSCSEGWVGRSVWICVDDENVGRPKRTRGDELFVGDDDGVPADVEHNVKIGCREVMETLVNACVEREEGWD